MLFRPTLDAESPQAKVQPRLAWVEIPILQHRTKQALTGQWPAAVAKRVEQKPCVELGIVSNNHIRVRKDIEEIGRELIKAVLMPQRPIVIAMNCLGLRVAFLAWVKDEMTESHIERAGQNISRVCAYEPKTDDPVICPDARRFNVNKEKSLPDNRPTFLKHFRLPDLQACRIGHRIALTP